MKLFKPLIVLLLFLTSCGTGNSIKQKEWFNQNGKIKILSTTAMIGEIVKKVGGDAVDSLVLIQGELDPHTYQLVKGDDEKLQYADFTFYNGLGLEHGPSLRYQLENNQNTIALGDKVKEADPKQMIYVNGQLDPHIWMDVSMWKKIVPFVKEALSKKDPKNSALFEKNAKAVLMELSLSDQKVKAFLQTVPVQRRFLVTSHDAFNYFARAYLATPEEVKEGLWKKRFQAPEGLAPESQLSVTDIQDILTHLEKYQIHVLFPESNVSRDSIRKIVSAGNEMGLKLTIAEEPLYGDAISEGGYPAMIEQNAKTIAKHLNQSTQ